MQGLMILAADLLSPSFGTFFWMLLVFGLLLYLLRRYAWGPITSALEEREENIAMSLSRAEKAMEEAKALRARNDLERREAEQEAQRLVREAREETERIRAAELARTREDIGAMRDRALQDIARDREAALQAVRSEVADLAILAAERILQSSVDAEQQRRLVDEFLAELPDS